MKWNIKKNFFFVNMVWRNQDILMKHFLKYFFYNNVLNLKISLKSEMVIFFPLLLNPPDNNKMFHWNCECCFNLHLVRIGFHSFLKVKNIKIMFCDYLNIFKYKVLVNLSELLCITPPPIFWGLLFNGMNISHDISLVYIV